VIDDESYFTVDSNESTKRPTDTDTANRRFLGELEKESLEQQLLSKRCKLLDGKDQKRSESIETMEIYHESGNSKSPHRKNRTIELR
jgi:hypothetical protein